MAASTRPPERHPQHVPNRGVGGAGAPRAERRKGDRWLFFEQLGSQFLELEYYLSAHAPVQRGRGPFRRRGQITP